MDMIRAGILTAILCVAGVLSLCGGTALAAEMPEKAAELFQETKIWNVHLKLTPQAWKEMEPTGGNFGPFGGPPPGGPPPGREGPPPPGGPGRPGGREGFNFGPSMFIAPGFLAQGDANKDSMLSAQEFQALAERWYTGWDKEKRGAINNDQLRAGLNKAFAMPPPGGPGPGGPGPGGPPPGGPMAFGLQGREGQRNGLASMMGIEFQYVHADLEFEGQTFKDVGLRYKGNGTFVESRASLKRSLKIDLNQYVKGQKLAGVATLNLHNNVTDASMMNEVLAFRAFRDAQVPAPRTAFARVFVTVPGKYDRQYFGLYSLVENVDKDFAEDNFGTQKGALFKPSTPMLFAYQGDDWKKYKQAYDPKTDTNKEEKQRLLDLCKLTTGASETEFAAKVGEFIDLDAFARYMAVVVWILDLDSLLDTGQNFYLHLHPKTQKFQFIAWDQDHSFGQFPLFGTQEEREQLGLLKPYQGEKRFLERIFKHAEFKKRYLAHVAEFQKTLFTPERFARQVDELAAAIRPAVKEESETKLARFEKAVAGESVTPSMPFMQPSKPIKPFVKARAVSVSAQLAGKSQGKTLGMFGFGGPGGPGGRQEDFGPGMFLAPAFLRELDANKDKQVSRAEFLSGFASWFKEWNTDKSGRLTDKQLREGIDKTLSPFRGGPPAFGSPPNPSRR